MSAAFYLSYVALWALVIFESLVLVGLVKSVQSARIVTEEPGDNQDAGLTGKPMPAFAAEDVFGASVDSKALVGQSTALLFVSPDCPSCAVTLQELEALMSRMDGHVVVICRAKHHRCASLAHHYNLAVPVISDDDRRLSDLFRIMAPPTAVLITADGQVDRYGQPMSGEDLRRLIAEQQGNGDREAPADNPGHLVVHTP